MTGPMLALDSVSKRYGRTEALSGLSLTVMPGEIFGLLGPNGAGKTTTLKIVAGLVTADSGTVRIAGLDAETDPDAARAMSAFVPDQPTLYPRLTGREFLRFVARARDLPGDTAEERISFHARLFEMEGWIDSRAESYSHGMTQRVALAAAFLSRPPLYVIDEPLVGLDPASAGTFDRMCRAASAEGASVILSTHTLPVARRMCDRIGIIHTGRLAATVESGGIGETDLEDLFFSITGTSPAEVEDYFR